MKIVQVSPFYYPVIGGVERIVKTLSEYLYGKGFDVYVVTFNRDRKKSSIFSKNEEINGVKIIRVKPDFSWSHGTYSKEIYNIVKSLNPDIIHVHVWRHPYVFQLSKISSIRILQPHSPFYSLKQSGIITFIYYNLVDNFLGSFIKKYNLISITPLEKEILYKKFKANSELIPNGVDDILFSMKVNEDNFYLYIGRLSKEKNIMKMLKAYRLSKTKRPLLLAGPDNGMLKYIKEYISKYTLNVKYLGEVSEYEKIELLSKCRALINPSPFEGFGLTLVEAEALGKPAIIVGHGGQEFAAPPNIASLRADNNETSIARAIENMEDDFTYSTLSKCAKKYAENFRMSNILPKYEKFYCNMINNIY